MKLKVRLAGIKDNQKLLKLIDQTPLDGNISLLFQRRPNFFTASHIEGKTFQTVVVANNDEVIASGNRNINEVYLNGKKTRIDYLNGLRIHPNYRGKGILGLGFGLIKKLHSDKKAPFYIISITSDNLIAQQALKSKEKNLPILGFYSEYCTYFVRISKVKCRDIESIKIMRANDNMVNDIIEFMAQYGKKKQFFPHFTKEDFVNGRINGFNIKDFHIAIKDGKLVGVIGMWNQQKFKQIIISKYKWPIRLLRPLYNLFAKSFNRTELPKEGKTLNFCYGSFIAIKDDNPLIFSRLLDNVSDQCLSEGHSYLAIGLPKESSLVESLKQKSYILYKSKIFLAYYKDGEKYIKNIKKGISYFELGML